MNPRTVFCCMVLLWLVLPAAAVQPASVVTVFHIRSNHVDTVSSTIVYGGSPNYFLENGDYIVTTSTAGGSYQNQAWIEDPRVRRLLDITEGEPSAVVRDDVDFTVILPYEAGTAKVSVFDKDRKLVAEADLSAAKNAFCSAHPADERCGGAVGGGAWTLVIVLAIVAVAGAWVYLYLKRKTPGER